ncbi:hypothetical protein BWI17_09290 [Betaproteobacteria bacterium GR16-43]|nr:hypothetical protein BWI17_09290 [Betaproteobacteria bacterium GR16-43]
MLMDFLGDLIAAALAAAIVAVVVFVWRLLRKAPFVMAGLGAALLAFAAGIAYSFGDINFRTEGSPAGTILFAVLGSMMMGAGFVGLVLAIRGLVDAANRSSAQLLGAVGTMLVVAAGVGSYFVKRPGGAGGSSAREAVEMPHRTDLPITQRSAVRSVNVSDAYALAWKERGDAPPYQMLIPASQFAYGTSVPETVDGPRHVDLRVIEPVDTAARLRLYRDGSELADPVYASLFGRLRAPADWQGALRVDESKRTWRLAGFDCEAPAFKDRAQAVSAAGAGCYAPQGFFARWLPWMSGPKRLRLDVRPAGRACQLTFLYRGRPVTLASPEACTDPATFTALVAALRLLGRLEDSVHGAPLAAERLQRAGDAVAQCERTRERALDTRRDICAYARSLAAAELEMSPGGAEPLLARAVAAEAGLRR